MLIYVFVMLIGWFGTGAAQAANIAGLGRLIPATDVVDLFGPSGDQVARVTVKEGQPVARDDVLARLRSHPANQAKKALAQLQLDEAKLRKELNIRIQKSRVDRLEVELVIARKDLDRLLGRSRAQATGRPRRPQCLGDAAQR